MLAVKNLRLRSRVNRGYLVVINSGAAAKRHRIAFDESIASIDTVNGPGCDRSRNMKLLARMQTRPTNRRVQLTQNFVRDAELRRYRPIVVVPVNDVGSAPMTGLLRGRVRRDSPGMNFRPCRHRQMLPGLNGSPINVWIREPQLVLRDVQAMRNRPIIV